MSGRYIQNKMRNAVTLSSLIRVVKFWRMAFLCWGMFFRRWWCFSQWSGWCI